MDSSAPRADSHSQASSVASPPSSGSRNLPKFEVSAVQEGNGMKELEGSQNNSNNATEDDGGGVIVIKNIEDADTSAVSPFIVSLPSEEGLLTLQRHNKKNLI